jgi:hypothetical protein
MTAGAAVRDDRKDMASQMVHWIPAGNTAKAQVLGRLV